MYIVIRSWQNAQELAEEMTRRQQDVVDLIGGVPGFIAYYATRSGDAVTTVTVCEDKAGTEESTKRAGDWVKENLKGSLGAPQITQGETFVNI